MKVKKICIVGGGSSGWMTAAGLSKHFPEIEITLIESGIAPVGVGESTLGHFNDFLNFMELKDEDWMPYCNATYKTSIAFKNFREGKGERFQYPFGKTIEGENVHFYYYLKFIYPDLYPPEEGSRYFNRQTLLTESGKFTKEPIEGINFDSSVDSAYHFDAAMFGEFLKKKIAIPNGVKHFNEKIEYCTKDEDGNLKAIHTKNGKSFNADLFIDCTGFKSLLLEKFMGVPFIDFKDYLFNDTALAAQIPYIDKEKQMTTWTDCVAMENGWVWEIPLWHRIGTGYVFSSKYTTTEKAEEEYRDYLSKTYSEKIAKEVKFKKINIKHGKHAQSWKKNVVAIGLSYGFIEPLESTGLLTTHENILSLADILDMSDGYVTQKWVDKFNFRINNMIDNMMVFVAYHYYFSKRKDNKYWKDCVNNINYFDKYLENKSDIWEKVMIRSGKAFYTQVHPNMWDFGQGNVFGIGYIALGQGINPISKFKYIKEIKNNSNEIEIAKNIHNQWQEEKKEIMEELKKLPSHYEYLRDYIHVLEKEKEGK